MADLQRDVNVIGVYRGRAFEKPPVQAGWSWCTRHALAGGGVGFRVTESSAKAERNVIRLTLIVCGSDATETVSTQSNQIFSFFQCWNLNIHTRVAFVVKVRGLLN